MNSKLAVRNVKRSARDYLVYFFTMSFVTALMFAFHTLLFSKDVRKMSELFGFMASMLGMATFFIVLIIAWLINYMVRFMMEKRSREFGIYLLLGMKKKEISRMYLKENLLLGAGAFLAGIIPGLLLQQLILSVLYSMVRVEHHLKLEFSPYCFLLTAACYGGCYLLALIRCRRKFRKMNIQDLMNAQRQNEEIRESHEQRKQWLFPLSLLFLAAFGVWMLGGKAWDGGTVLLFLVGLVLVIYLFYTGLSSWIVCRIRKKGKGIYKGQRLFLLRQFSSKVKTMQFTMGTLTALFTLALLGCSVAMMFNDYQNRVLQDKWPFDVQIYSRYAEDDFHREMEILEKETEIRDVHRYCIYENETNAVNAWLYTHLSVFDSRYLKKDGTPDTEKIRKNEEQIYCDYDTYMGLSDYNDLRKMIGLGEISLNEGQYAIHLKDRIFRETGDFSPELAITGQNGNLVCAGIYTEPFSQDGHNGGDYILVVPDKELMKMNPYYAELAVNLKGSAPENLQENLDNLADQTDFGGHAEMGDWEDSEDWGNYCYGTDTIVTYAAKNLVRDNLIPEVKYMLTGMMFPLFYAGLVFLCVALTVLSVQQLSDSVKYRFRYGVLQKIGLGKKEIRKMIFQQLFGYYMCPAILAGVISGIIAVYTGSIFNYQAGMQVSSARYFMISCALFLGIYAIYFMATYLGF